VIALHLQTGSHKRLIDNKLNDKNTDLNTLIEMAQVLQAAYLKTIAGIEILDAQIAIDFATIYADMSNKFPDIQRATFPIATLNRLNKSVLRQYQKNKRVYYRRLIR